MSAVQRPFKVLGVQQIAIGGPDKVRLQKLWVDMLGLEVTGTFKHRKVELAKEGFDPATVADPLWFRMPETGDYVRLDPALRARIVSGGIRL